MVHNDRKPLQNKQDKFVLPQNLDQILNCEPRQVDTYEPSQSLNSSRRVQKMNEALILSKDSRTKKIDLANQDQHTQEISSQNTKSVFTEDQRSIFTHLTRGNDVVSQV